MIKVEKEKWIFEGNEEEILIVSDEDIDYGNDVNLEDTTEFSIDEVKRQLEDTGKLDFENLENTKKMDIIEED